MLPLTAPVSAPINPKKPAVFFWPLCPGEDVARLAYFGLFALQHRGQESAGITTFEESESHSYKHMGLVSQVLTTIF